MTPELKKLIVERYTGWAATWGLSFAFAVTQNVEKAERIVADAIVALIAAEVKAERDAPPAEGKRAGAAPQLPSSVSAVRFASVLWELANAQAYRGFGADSFFRMPAVTRAIVILKIRAQFSRSQIAAAVNLRQAQIDDHLENSRLLFSDGRSWIPTGPVGSIDGDRWVAECPQWNTSPSASDALGSGASESAAMSSQDSDGLQGVFAQYVGNDLDADTGQKLQSHLVVCNTCRTSFSHFKKQYVDWAGSIPVIEPDQELRKHLHKVTRMALKIDQYRKPSPWPGLRRILRDAQVRALIFGAISVLFLQYVLRHRQ